MAGELQAYLARFPLDSGSLVFKINNGGGDQTVTLEAGDRYPKGYTSESPDQFVEHVTTKIQAASGFGAGDTCTLDLTTGLITFTWGTANCALTWVDTTLRALMGFAANLSSAALHVAPNAMRYLWLPSLSPSMLPVNLTEFWMPRSNSKMPLSTDGTPGGRAGKLQDRAAISYDLLDLAEVLIPAGGGVTSNKTFERFWRDACHGTWPIRILPDRTSYTSTTYKSGNFGNPEGDLGDLRDWISPSFGEASHDSWDVEMFFAKYEGTGA
jgi:hypothetical protein